MAISTKDGLTDRQATQFFAAPESPLLRQYEALRAYFIDQLPSADVARRFGYSPGSFRVLCHQFRHDADYRDRSLPCANGIDPSTTSNANWPPPATPLASTP